MIEAYLRLNEGELKPKRGKSSLLLGLEAQFASRKKLAGRPDWGLDPAQIRTSGD